ncbi:MAG: MarR family transcriptional regulator [Patulibacter minatonensis]
MSADDAHDELARSVWLAMSDLVIENTRRREVAEAVGMSFGRTRALRRLARRPMSMRELADALDIDPANATAVVDTLERAGLAVRRPHPTDRRAKLVDLTDEGRRLGETANAILSEPPPALSGLGDDELTTLLCLLAKADPSAA